MKHQVFQYLNNCKSVTPASVYAIFSELSLSMGNCIHKFPREKNWEQHWQWDTSDKENKSTSLRNIYFFEAWKRKQEHHLSGSLVSQVEAKHGVGIQHYNHLGCMQLKIQTSEKNKTQQRETLANPAVNYFTGNSIWRTYAWSQEVSANPLAYFLISKSFSNTLPASLQTYLILCIYIYLSQYDFLNSFLYHQK